MRYKVHGSTPGIVIKSLTVAIMKQKPHIFFPYLFSKNVETTFPNKLRFYEFFKHMLGYAYQIAMGPMHLKIETPNWEKEGYVHYCFYNKYHLHSRFYVKVKQTKSKIVLDIPPF